MCVNILKMTHFFIITIFVYMNYQYIKAERTTNLYHTVDLKMPDVQPLMMDDYICTAMELNFGTEYIVEYEPHAEASRSHHMLLFGCLDMNENRLYPRTWRCSHSNLCPGMSILYAWAKNAPTVILPSGVGFRVGADTTVKYLVLQMHYAHLLPSGIKDSSGIILHLTKSQQKYIGGIHILYSKQAAIPPYRPKFHVDVNCKFQSNQVIHPFAFRVHGHSLGLVISGYIYDSQAQTWTLLGKGDPQQPQSFYPTSHLLTVKPGDILAARCTYNSTGVTKNVYIGPNSSDEMCNFYIMYYTRIKNGQSYGKCVDVEIPELNQNLPEGNDIQLHTGLSMEQNIPRSDPETFVPSISSSDYFHVDKKDQVVGPSDHSTPTGETVIRYEVNNNWPATKFKFGQISAVAVDNKGRVVVFHRGSHIWNSLTFDFTNHYQLIDRGPIEEEAVVVLNEETGKIEHVWGSNLFYMPHGLTVDANGSFWLTDVALHQVLKFSSNGLIQPMLVLGEKFIPGSDNTHFCKPTSAVVSVDGDIFVADGYCNSRIVRFTSKGKYINQWGRHTPLGSSDFPSSAFNIPHKLTLIHDKGMVCVADRENGRIQCFSIPDGKFIFQLSRPEFGGRLFSVSYSSEKGGLLYAVCGPAFYGHHRVLSFVFNFTSLKLLSTFAPPEGTFSQPHDIAVTPDSQSVYVGEIGPNNVWMFSRGKHKSVQKALPEAQPTTSPSWDDDAARFKPLTVSLMVIAVLAVPVLILLTITIIVKLRKRGKLKNFSYNHLKHWCGGYKTPHSKDKFNIGSLLNPHQGFDRVALEESDLEGEEGTDSEVEEFDAAVRRA
ncbi:peptidyl-glycine alpha-amidating monooxygenase-like [Limulus polyphemus]|uniref:Peptidyl-glycine alpha-amidating monooxygenase-like n=1 Tax=Limulus polyphemus TaxID=6850 RepID=A0ABM1SY43_LIMPO|nr:peptidyl-glycine alpha-amidating monooxygenase-like [Limulus polyphemus]XP_022248549.1 peptidyl-glycine alpha-amidating monooxygenase-like [Limulus polyphemus]